ncbi:MAG: D-alanyl-D-alanine carboxypeptidase family protein [Thermacetogeniaceae bacterium]
MRYSARKLVMLAVVLAFALQLAPARAWSETPSEAPALETNAASAVLMDAYTGKILYQKEPDKQVAPASVTKILTLLVALDSLHKGKVNWDDRVVTSEEAWEMGGSEIWLEPGESMTFREMMIAIAVGSANDACVAVAEHIAGSEQAYVALMNEKAKSLGCKNTHFVNAHGLPAKDHYTSAYDMALICREALKYPELLQLTSIRHYNELRGGKVRLDNTNKLLWWYDGADGFKTGWTAEANYCLAATAKRGDLRLISCLFGVPEPRGHFRESTKLLNWGFANYGFRTLAQAGQVMGKVRVGSGTVDQVDVVAPRNIGVLIKKGEEGHATLDLKLPKMVVAPVQKGAPLGEVRVIEQGKVLETVALQAKDEVPRGSFWRMFDKGFRSLVK